MIRQILSSSFGKSKHLVLFRQPTVAQGWHSDIPLFLRFHNFFGTTIADVKSKEEHKESAKGFQKTCSPEYQEGINVAIIGAPNAGKSVLTNTLIGKKVTAVSNKTNTTRREMLGALTRGNKQMLLYDTPGVVGSDAELRSDSFYRRRL